MPKPIEAWRADFRLLAAHLPTCGLEALRRALLTDDGALLQSFTVWPCPHDTGGPDGREAEAGCALALPWMEAIRQAVGRPATVEEVNAAFFATLDAVEFETRVPGKGCHFLEAFDAWPRQTMRARLLPEVNAILARRAEVEAAAR